MKFIIKHKTENEEEYNSIMDIIKHYEIVRGEYEKSNKISR